MYLEYLDVFFYQFYHFIDQYEYWQMTSAYFKTIIGVYSGTINNFLKGSFQVHKNFIAIITIICIVNISLFYRSIWELLVGYFEYTTFDSFVVFVLENKIVYLF